MSEVKYKHFFTIKDGQFVWERKEMLDFDRKRLEGKRGYAIIEEVTEGPSTDQYAYYFGGIIRKECMVSNVFGGMKEKEVHTALLMESGFTTVVTFEHPTRGRVLYYTPEDIKRWSKRRMSEYIEQVIALLNTEYQIYPKPSEHYKDNKYYMDTKTLK